MDANPGPQTGHPPSGPGAQPAGPPPVVRGMELPAHLARLRRGLPPSVMTLGRGVARTAGIASARGRDLPDFLIIGAKKAGTSSLMNWLAFHPAVARMFPAAQRLKSPHYFDVNYWRGERWYRSHFASRGARRRQSGVARARVVTGEASPYYLFHPAAPSRVARDLPAVRVIVLLRDPVARAYSNYWDRRASGHESLATFEQALAAEPERMASVDTARLLDDPRYYSSHHDNHSYLARGRYLQHLQGWLDVVPAERLLIVRAESMFTDPGAWFGEVQRFLAIPRQPPVGGSLRRYNQRSQPPMRAETRAWLSEYYRPHNEALAHALGTDMGWPPPHPPQV